MLFHWFAQRGSVETGTSELPCDETVISSDETRIGLVSPLTLTVIGGPPDLIGARFTVGSPGASIGRDPRCEIAVPERSVSRRHAEIERIGDRWVITHRSGTNRTTVNGARVDGEMPLRDGDEIHVAGTVALRVDAPGERRRGAARGAALRAVMEERADLDDYIEREFMRHGTFLDIDVVDSYGMKQGDAALRDVIVSFERFREFLARRIDEFGGRILNSNGDEVMAFFDDADRAVDAAAAIRVGLEEFNRSENRLARPFEVRMGAHTGRSAVDLESGIAYSSLLDLAGHLQKAAAVGGLMVSTDAGGAVPGGGDEVVAFSVRL